MSRVQVALIASTQADLSGLVGACIQVLGRSPAEAADESGLKLSDHQRFLWHLASIRDQNWVLDSTQRSQRATDSLTDHIHLTFLIVADDFEIAHILGVVGGDFVIADAKVPGVLLAVVTAPLTRWLAGEHLVRRSTPVAQDCYTLVKNQLVEHGYC